MSMLDDWRPSFNHIKHRSGDRQPEDQGNMTRPIIEGLALIFQGIDRLDEMFPRRTFTIDGRLVGDYGKRHVSCAQGAMLELPSLWQVNLPRMRLGGMRVGHVGKVALPVANFKTENALCSPARR